MGQKVNPVGMRIGVSRNWNSRWYANDQDYHIYLHQDIKIRKYLDKELRDASYSHTEIERVKTDKGQNIRILVFAARPGVVIGDHGENINRIITDIGKIVGSEAELKVDVIEVKQPDLDAKIVADSIARQLEERMSYRIVQKKAILRVRKAGAKGVKTLVSGRLGGTDIARGEGYKEGIIPLQTLRSDIDYAVSEAKTTYGQLGVKVWICRGEVPCNKFSNINKEGE